MDDRDQLQQRMIEIGTRYLRRTLGELAHLRELVARLHAGAQSNESEGDVSILREIEQMAHKIHGSGAMFGFEEVSERARDVELLAANRSGDAQSAQRLEEFVALLERDVRTAAGARGIE